MLGPECVTGVGSSPLDLNNTHHIIDLPRSLLSIKAKKGASKNFHHEQLKTRFKERRSLDISCTEMSADNLTMNITKFDGANYKQWFGHVKLLLESKHVLGIVTGDLKELEALAENASASERLVHMTLMESYVDKHVTARSTFLLTMEERLQLEIQVESQEVEVPHSERTFAYEADTAEDDGKGLAVRKRKKATVIPDGKHIFYLLYNIPNNDDWKIFLKLKEDKDAEDTMWSSEVITKMLEHEKKLKQEKGLGHDIVLFAKQCKGRGNGNGNGKGKGKGKDNKGNGKF
ncbi:hypothetical protein K440DRAFT_644075 [Wilcoxina mikolae CBS 423.85]|nr:hypothetical protein K440DRAFT_644075 [Wilcoxina mikolae CBS 423.85]